MMSQWNMKKFVIPEEVGIEDLSNFLYLHSILLQELKETGKF